MVKLTINEKEVEVPEGFTILQAARKAGIDIPTLCSLEPLTNVAVCRLCLVEVKGARALVPACATPVAEGMVVRTNTDRVLNAIEQNLEFIASEHDFDCQNCPRNGNCELQILAYRFNLDKLITQHHTRNLEPDTSSPAITLNYNKCVLCSRCIRTCAEIQTVYALDYAFRGYDTIVTTPFNEGLGNSSCVSCGLCTLNCPVGALTEKVEEDEVISKISLGVGYELVADDVARLALPEEFWYAPGSFKEISEEEIKNLGFKKVMSGSFFTGLSIVAEAQEVLRRLENGSIRPLISPACPAASEFIEKFFPEFKENIIRVPSQLQLLMKEFDKKENIVILSQCIAKKKEIKSKSIDVDYVLSVREMARLIKKRGGTPDSVKVVDFKNPSPEILDYVSGGRTELVIRTLSNITGYKLEEGITANLRDPTKKVKSISLKLNSREFNFVAVNTLGELRKVLEAVKSGEKIDYIEARACPGGCVSGGGMPIPTNEVKRLARLKAIYEAYDKLKLKDPWRSPEIRAAYQRLVEAIRER
ncbi:MAG: [Fe-Fe] hydrogenase large subunit C-terminal domain-containing protein [Thermoproteota archaeon]